jgi:hypothetical protein
MLDGLMELIRSTLLLMGLINPIDRRIFLLLFFARCEIRKVDKERLTVLRFHQTCRAIK